MTARAFHNKMVEYLDGYQMYLLLVKPNENVVFHCTIIHEFINYVYNYHLVFGIDQITVSMANSKFYADFKRQNKEVVPKETMKEILKDFFIFLDGKYGIKNEKLIRGFGITNVA